MNWLQVLFYWMSVEVLQAIGYLSERCGAPGYKCFKPEQITAQICDKLGYHKVTTESDLAHPSHFIFCPEVGSSPCLCPCHKQTRHSNKKMQRRMCAHQPKSLEVAQESDSIKLVVRGADNETHVIVNCSNSENLETEAQRLCNVVIQQQAKRSVFNQKQLTIGSHPVAISDPVPVIGWVIALVAILLVVLTVVLVTVLY